MTPGQTEIAKAVALIGSTLHPGARFVLIAAFPNGEFLSAQNVNPADAMEIVETYLDSMEENFPPIETRNPERN